MLQKRLLFSNFFVITGKKFKHHKYSENVNFEETNNVVSILGHILVIKTEKFVSSLTHVSGVVTLEINSISCQTDMLDYALKSA